MTDETTEAAVTGLYTGPSEQFVRRRDQLAAALRADGDREGARRVKALRRPTAAASVLNRLAGDPSMRDLAQFGERMRTAQEHLDPAAMRSLGAERTAVIRQVLRAAEAREPLTPAVRDQLTATLTAAIADPAAADAVRSGRLTAALSYSGFGEVDLSDALARWTPQRAEPETPPDPRAEQQLAHAQTRVEHAERDLQAAAEELSLAQRRHAQAEQALADARAAVAQLRRRLRP